MSRKVSKPNPAPQCGARDGQERFVTDPIDARECLSKGEAEPLARYLFDDVSRILQSLADELNRIGKPKGTPSLSQSSDFDPKEGAVSEWDNETSMVLQAIRSGDLGAAASFLQDFAALAEKLGRVLDPRRTTSEGMATQVRAPKTREATARSS